MPAATPATLSMTATAVVVDAMNSTVVVNWKYPGNDERGFEVELADLTLGQNAAEVAQPGGAAAFSYPITNLVTGHRYQVRMRVDKSDGTVSDWQGQLVTPTPTLVPTVTATPAVDSSKNHYVRVGWSCPAGVAGTPDVRVQWNGTGTADPQWASDGLTHAAADGPFGISVGDGQSATVRLMMVGVADGGWGTATVAQGGTAGPADAISVAPNADGTTTLTWGGNVAGATYLPAIYDATGQEVYQWHDPTSAGSAVISDLTPGATYYPVLDAQTSQPAPYSGTVTLHGYTKLPPYTAPGYTPPPAPANLVITLTSATTVAMHWQDQSRDEAGFDVYYSATQDFTGPIHLAGTTGPDVSTFATALPDATTEWYYRVYSFVAAGVTPPVPPATRPTTLPVAGQSTTAAAAVGGGLTLTRLAFDGERHTPTDNDHPEYALQPIERDHDGTNYGSAQWLDLNGNGRMDAGNTPVYLDGTVDSPAGEGLDHEYPISYMRSLPDSPAYIEVAVTIHAIKAAADVHLVGTGDGFTYSQWADLAAGDNTLTLFSTVKVPDTIQSKDLAIKWTVSFDRDKTTSPLVTTHNHLYVTGAPAEGPYSYQTSLWVGCEGAKGLRPQNPGEDAVAAAAANEKVLTSIFDTQFKSLKLYEVDHSLMTYWGDSYGLGAVWPAPRKYAATLLKYHDGRCEEWAESFMLLVLYAQGVNHCVSMEVTATAPNGAPAQPANQKLDDGQYYVTRPGFYTPAMAQGGKVPTEKWFADHIIEEVTIEKTCFVLDPSYGVRVSGGTKKDAEDAWKAQAIAAGAKFVWVIPGGYADPQPNFPAGEPPFTGNVAANSLFPITPADLLIGTRNKTYKGPSRSV